MRNANKNTGGKTLNSGETPAGKTSIKEMLAWRTLAEITLAGEQHLERTPVGETLIETMLA